VYTDFEAQVERTPDAVAVSSATDA